MASRADLLTILNLESSASQWTGCQTLLGSSLGLGLQQPLIVVETVPSLKGIASDTPILILHTPWQVQCSWQLHSLSSPTLLFLA
jgi:hypothetical protein